MIELRLSAVLEKRGRSSYWLSKQTGIRYATIWQMVNGKVARLSLEVLDQICKALECQPGALLVRIEKRKLRKRGK